jgi:branched-chain amino acid transport system permease protein
MAALLVGVVQQLANYYLSSGIGDVSVVLLLAAVLLVRPGGLTGRTA